MNRSAAAPAMASYFEAFSSNHSWPKLCEWPPDVFAFANLHGGKIDESKLSSGERGILVDSRSRR